ncbi:unnamed protein product [Paramecium octaurelia]|uniref:Uncharacterized protein n=1 Tax=Paramecium octaurelia TaxID=43137 RepID=A0A8S1X1D0_PAROT|nr:unnamed protein product [Paramecium octaurelia]
MSETYFEFDYLLRIILVGDTGIGKSSLLMRYTDQEFQQNLLPTIGIDFKTKIIEQSGKNVKLQFWDTAGQERFRTISRNYYRGAHAIFFVYDITDRDSFKRIEYWMNEVEQNSQPDTIKVLIGNKSDLNYKREVNFDEGKELAQSQGLEFFESSALENRNIENAINFVVKLWLKKQELEEKKQLENRQANPVLQNSFVSIKKKSLFQLCQC